MAQPRNDPDKLDVARDVKRLPAGALDPQEVELVECLASSPAS